MRGGLGCEIAVFVWKPPVAGVPLSARQTPDTSSPHATWPYFTVCPETQAPVIIPRLADASYVDNEFLSLDHLSRPDVFAENSRDVGVPDKADRLEKVLKIVLRVGGRKLSQRLAVEGKQVVRTPSQGMQNSSQTGSGRWPAR